VTGLSPKDVYQGEQRRLLRVSTYIGQNARDEAIDYRVGAIHVKTSNRPVAAVFNQLGFERQRHLVHIDSEHLQGVEILDRLDDQQTVQYACEAEPSCGWRRPARPRVTSRS
jgi:hypothetical protein